MSSIDVDIEDPGETRIFEDELFRLLESGSSVQGIFHGYCLPRHIHSARALTSTSTTSLLDFLFATLNLG